MLHTISFLTFLVLLFFEGNLSAQQIYTYGPVKENFTTPSWGINGVDDYVGINCCPAVQFRVIKKWVWAYSNLPYEVEVKSVRLRFLADKYRNAPSHFIFNIHNLTEDITNPQWPYNIILNYPVSLSGTTITDINGHESFDITADENNNSIFFNAVKNAVNNQSYYLCLGFKIPNESGPNGWYEFRPFENFNDYQGYAVDLFINYEIPEYGVQFFNSIGGSLNYGSLILNNDIENPIPSGSNPSFALNDNVDIRTAEMPFIIDWNQTGTTQKHNYWDLQSGNLQYVLHNNFQVKSNSPPIQKSTFNGTSPVTIKNKLERTDINGGTLWFYDPWFYYEDANNWLQSVEFKEILLHL